MTLPASIDRLETPEENGESYKTIEFMLNKRMSNRWSLMVAAHHLWAKDTASGKIENPNEALYNEYGFTNWAFKVSGTYQAPWGLVFTPLVRHQSGDPLRRLVPVTLRSGTFNYTGEGFGKYRVDNPTIFDIRLEKRFQLAAGHRFGVFFDGFNLTNSNAAEAMDDVVGRRTTTLPSGERVEFAQFMRPTAILNPRVYRFGVKYRFLIPNAVQIEPRRHEEHEDFSKPSFVTSCPSWLSFYLAELISALQSRAPVISRASPRPTDGRQSRIATVVRSPRGCQSVASTRSSPPGCQRLRSQAEAWSTAACSATA